MSRYFWETVRGIEGQSDFPPEHSLFDGARGWVSQPRVANPKERRVLGMPLADAFFGPGLEGSFFSPAELYFRHCALIVL